MLIEKETEVLQLRELFDESQQKLKKISVEKDNVDQWKAVAEKKITLIEYELKVTKEFYNSQKDQLHNSTLANSEHLKKIRDHENTLI